MLLLKTLAAAVLSSLAQASPVARDQGELGGILICTDANARGHCEYAVYELETCHDLSPPLLNNAATFAPENAPFYCYPYIMECDGSCMSPSGCTMGAVSYNSPNKFNLTKVGWNRHITSFQCHLNKTAVAEGALDA